MRPRFITRIDWVKLQEQKLELINRMNHGGSVESNNKLRGILHLIDHIQDYAVDSMGLCEEQVFNFKSE